MNKLKSYQRVKVIEGECKGRDGFVLDCFAGDGTGYVLVGKINGMGM